MISRSIIISLALFLSVSGYTQHLLSGKVIDDQTEQPVADAHVLLANGRATSTDHLGRFSIRIKEFPVILRISHVSYGQADTSINSNNADTLIIRLKKQISDLGEVEISAQKLRILTEKDDFSLTDIAFDHDNLWMIGYMNNMPRKGRLWQANDYGDTTAEERQEYEYVYGHNARKLMAIYDMPLGYKKAMAWRAYYHRKRTKKLQLYRGLKAPVFINTTHLHVMNPYKDSMLVYDSAVRFAQSIPITFHRTKSILGVDYKNLSYLYDQSTDQNYCLRRDIDGWQLNPFDVSKGKLLPAIGLPDFPGMTHITIHHNAVYFIYHEKKYPFYARLYRYQL